MLAPRVASSRPSRANGARRVQFDTTRMSAEQPTTVLSRDGRSSKKESFSTRVAPKGDSNLPREGRFDSASLNIGPDFSRHYPNRSIF